MSLVELWQNSRIQLDGKHIQQIIAFAGAGQLKDGNSTSDEFRTFLDHIPSSLLRVYAEQCLQESFSGSGFALQDIVNQVGKRLGFQIKDGRYRGSVGQIGFDGLWFFPEGHCIIVEVKTTDTYRIDLNTIANYRRSLTKSGQASETASSILIVVGRNDTGDLEAQIRGSRHAWDIRLISIDALMRLMAVKEEVENPKIVYQIHSILVPREFTKLDDIVELVFSTAEDIKPEIEKSEKIENDVNGGFEQLLVTPVSFHNACIERAESYFRKSLVKRTRTTYSSPDGITGMTCAVSKNHIKGGENWYWFAFHRTHKDFLEQFENGYVAFGCGSENNLLLIPFRTFCTWLDDLSISETENRYYWHINISSNGNRLFLHRKGGAKPVELTDYLFRSS